MGWIWWVTAALAGTPDLDAVDTTLDTLHRAAAEADAETYFGLFADDAVFIGTDATERWDLQAFQAFAAPHFEQAPAWAYTPVSREVHAGPRGRIAWFYETLNHERHGAVRGSGVLRVERGAWRLTQYVLSFPIPNEAAADVVARVQGSPPTLPPPFTAAAIRAAYVPGLISTWRMTTPDRTWLRQVEVLAADRDTMTMRGGPVDAAGAALEPHDEAEATWTELRDHAAFPPGTTWTDEVGVTVPAGDFETRRYVVPGDDGVVATFWFALEQPGPPVKMERARGETVLVRMELVSRVVPPTP